MSPRRLVVLIVIMLTVIGSNVSAQDVTAPALLEFTISPVVFDASQGDIVIDWCATVQDDLSGLSSVGVILDPFVPGTTNSVDLSGQGVGPITICTNGGSGRLVFPQFGPFVVYDVFVVVIDVVGNTNQWRPGLLDLCSIGPCLVENTPLDNLSDTDEPPDGIPDIADNCPDVANTDQADADLDLIGDACDPFRNDRNNAQAQCEQDLGQALGDAATCGQELGQCQGDLGTAQTALQQALTAIAAMRECLASYKKENGVRCRDDVDNDCDGLIDGDDPDCQK